MRAALALGSVIAITMSQLGLAQPFETPPPAGPPRAVAIAAPFEQTLANGLKIIVAQRSGLPLVTAELLIRSGSEAEPPALAGLADLTATLLTKGTKHRTAPQIADAAEALGGQLASGAHWYRSSVAITVTRPQLAAALDLIADVTIHPAFAREELERARRLALDALNVALARPDSLAGMAAIRAAFGAGTYGHLRSGTAASLKRISRGDLRRLHATLYRPDNAALIFAGDIEPADALLLAEGAFGRWKRPAAPLRPSEFAVGEPIAYSTIAIDMPGAGQAGVVVAAPSIARGAADYYPGVVANAVLGAGYSSRLNQEIRIRRGLSYSAGSALDARRDGGVFIADAQTKNPSAPQVVGLMLEEITKLGAAPVEPGELEARKAALIGGFSRSLETTAGLAANIAGRESDGVPLREIQRVIERVTAVTPGEVQAFAATHWPAAALRVVVAGDAREFDAALHARGPSLLVLRRDQVNLDAPGLTRK